MRQRTPTPTQRLIDRTQGEALTGIPARTLYDWIVRGVLPVVQFPGSRKLWIDRADLDALIDASKGSRTSGTRK